VFGMGTIKGGSRATKKAGHDVVHIYRESERAREREREREREPPQSGLSYIAFKYMTSKRLYGLFASGAWVRGYTCEHIIIKKCSKTQSVLKDCKRSARAKRKCTLSSNTLIRTDSICWERGLCNIRIKACL